MASVTHSAIWKYAQTLQRISRKARDDFLSAVSNVDLTDMEEASETLKRVGRMFLEKYGAGAKELAAQWYDYCRELEVGSGYTAFIGETSRYGIESDFGALVDKYTAGELSEPDFIARLGGVMVKQVHREARNTIMNNMEYEYSYAKSTGNKKLADKIGFCRVPSPGACAFCILLASQPYYGVGYTNEYSAGKGKGAEYHEDCNCTIVPFTKATSIPGYQDMLQNYVDAYEKANDMRTSFDLPEDLQKRIDDAKAEHERLYAEGKVDKKWQNTNANLIIMRYNDPTLK